jgi:integrase
MIEKCLQYDRMLESMQNTMEDMEGQNVDAVLFRRGFAVSGVIDGKVWKAWLEPGHPALRSQDRSSSMKGNITKRGEHSWRLKFDAGCDAAGQRKTQYVTFRGTKREAQLKLAALIASVGQGSYVEPSKAAVAEFVRGRVDVWEAAGDITARTAKRYRQLVENQIAPHLGLKPLQKLTRLDVEGWHAELRASGLAPRTIGHAHKTLGKALRDAERDDLITRNVCKLQAAPRVSEREMVIVQDVPGFVAKLHGSRFYVLTVVALFTGMRLGEVLALRWSRIDLDRKRLEVREALEPAKGGVGFKAPKTKAGRRDISLPDILVEVLREYRREQLQLRLQLGLGRLPDDALLFTRWMAARSTQTTSHPTGANCAQIGMPKITFHSCGTPMPANSLLTASISSTSASAWVMPAEHYAGSLRPHVHQRRQQGAAVNAALSSVGANPVPIVRVCSENPTPVIEMSCLNCRRAA